jgi:polyhydroxybutyrate depolymerase
MSKRAKKVFWSLTPAVLAFFALAPFSNAQDDATHSRLFENGSGGHGNGFAGRFGRGRGDLRKFASINQSIEGRWSGKGKPQLKELVVGGNKRRFYFYQPDSATLPAPLVLAFHGGGGTAEGTDKCAGGLAKLADEKGFIVVFPDAIDRHWNDGRPGLSKTNYDDVGFIAKVIDDLNSQKLIDPKRVYATGISNGGFFSQYLAIQLPGKIAAVATVAASVSRTFLDLKVTPVPIMLLLGTRDTLVPWDGGRIGGKLLRNGRGEVIPGRQALEFWLTSNQNTDKPSCTELPDNDPGDDSRVFVEQYGADGSANEVVLYEIRGGGHTWPAGQQYLPKSFIGPVCRDFDGNKTIWSFFEKHALR